MAFFLPAQPSFGNRLADVLGQASADIGAGLAKRAQNQKTQANMGVLINPNSSDIEKTAAFMRLPEEIKKSAGPVLASVLGPSAQANAELAQVEKFRRGEIGQIPPAGQGISQQQQPMPAAMGGQPVQGQQAPQQSPMPGDMSRASEQDLNALAAISGPIGKMAQNEIERRHRSEKLDVEAFKTTSDYREKVLSEYEASKKTINQLERMEALDKQNKLTKPLMAKLSESMGIPLSVLSNPASEEYQKLSQDLMSNITKTFGNRILQVEVENFLKTIPTLLNSQEGRQRIVKNMKMLLEPQKLAYEAYKDIRKEGGRTPIDLHERVLERMEPKLDKLAEDFKKNAGEFAIIISPDGAEVKVPRNKVDEAMKAGGILK